MTPRRQYTYPMIENTMHIHTCANNNNNDFFFFFLHIYKYAYPEHEQMNPKGDVDNGWTPTQVLRQPKTLSNKMAFSN